MKPTEEQFEQLAEGYFLQDLTEEETLQLEEGIQSDPEFAKRFIEAARDEWLLSEYQQARRAKVIAFPKPVQPRVPTRNPAWRIAAIIVALVALGSLLFVSQRTLTLQTYIANVTRTTPEAAAHGGSDPSEDSRSVFRNGDNAHPLKFGTPLFDGDQIEVPDEGEMTFTYVEEETVVKMGGGAVFTLHDDNGAKVIALEEGHMSADVARQAAGKPMRIRTPDAQAVVVGTSFEVSVGKTTTLSVITGLVRFTPDHTAEPVDVSAGEQVDTSDRFTSRQLVLRPVHDVTLGKRYRSVDLVVDPRRNYSALLKFDLGPDITNITTAELRVRAVRRSGDKGGGGHIRLFSVPVDTKWDTPGITQRVQLAEYRGRLTDGEDLILTIGPSDLKPGMNAFLIAMDEKGDDFRISSSSGPVAPTLVLEVRDEE